MAVNNARLQDLGYRNDRNWGMVKEISGGLLNMTGSNLRYQDNTDINVGTKFQINFLNVQTEQELKKAEEIMESCSSFILNNYAK